MNWGIKVLQTSALPLGYGAVYLSICNMRSFQNRILSKNITWSGIRGSNPLPQPWQGCALPDELIPHKYMTAGRDPEIIWCLRSESNQRHEDFQSSALPTELQRHIPFGVATRMGFEPTTSAVTGRRSNQLNYRAVFAEALVGTTGLEPVTLCL